ncbi:hypothetical protein AAVH_20708 [Aphelenchoides avenae]|nr:hypothetical protein AAVH_20708 [Aphelenchus avenae]
MAFNKVLVCVVFCLALVALSSAACEEGNVPGDIRCTNKRQANPPCPSGYFYNEGKGECTNALLAGGGK